MAKKGEEVAAPESKRMFINNVDLYQGSNLARFLSNCVVGASLEEVEEEDDEAKSISSSPAAEKEGCYEIIATLKHPESKKPDFVKEIIQYQTKEQLYEHLYECDFIVYDITEDPDQIDEATYAVSELHSDIEKMDSAKVFILISSVLTWARSKPLDVDDPEIPFTEEDYRRRKPHPNYKDHISAEKTVIKMGKTNKNKLVTYVIASGLTYGCGESIFHFMFKAAWHNTEQLPCFGNGENVVPTIHVKDLAAVIQNIADSQPKVRYLVAVDDSSNTLEEIVKAVSQNLGTGQTKMLSKEEALLLKDIKQSDFDQLLVDLRMDAVYVKENMHISWVAEAGLVENIQDIIREYRTSRGLMPMKIFIHGPPASGKTSLSELMCKHYNLHHIQLSNVLEEAILDLERCYDDVEDDQSEDEDNEDRQLVRRIHTVREESRERIDNIILEDILDESQITRFLRERLTSMPCFNQGFILDGYPKTFEQSRDLFAVEDIEESTAEEARQITTDPLISPTYIFILEASDEVLKERVLQLSEVKLAQTYRSDTTYARLLAEYREANPEEDTKNAVYGVFGEEEISIVHIDVSQDQVPDMKKTMNIVLDTITDAAISMGPTENEQFDQLCIEMTEQLRKQAADENGHQRHLAEMEQNNKLQAQQKMLDYERSVQDELNLLTERSLPLRNYLLTFVLPTLIKGLIQTCKTRPSPEQCIDYLAEYLFTHNPQIGFLFPGPLPWHQEDEQNRADTRISKTVTISKPPTRATKSAASSLTEWAKTSSEKTKSDINGLMSAGAQSF